MPLDEMMSIIAVEDEARKAKFQAEQDAQSAIEDEIRAGEKAVAATLARAESEIAGLKRTADQNAARQALELASTTANRQATLRARAERRLDSAAILVIERIWNV